MQLEGYRKILGLNAADLTDAQIQQLVEVSSALAAVVVDAFTDVHKIDQSKFSPPGDSVDFLNNMASPSEGAQGGQE